MANIAFAEMANGLSAKSPPPPPPRNTTLRAPLYPKQPSFFNASAQAAANSNSTSIPAPMSSSDVVVVASSIVVVLTVFCGCIGVIRGIIFWIKRREELADRMDGTTDLSESASTHTRALRDLRRERRIHRFRESEGRRAAFGNRNSKGLSKQRVAQLGGVFEFHGEADTEQAGGTDEAECNVECSVCLDNYQKGESLRKLAVCGHVFHQECLDSWLEIHGSCPLCRKKAYICPHRSETGSQEQADSAADSVTIEVSYSFLDTPESLARESSTQRGSQGRAMSGDLEGLQLPAVRWTVVRVGSSRRSQVQVSPAPDGEEAVSMERGEREAPSRIERQDVGAGEPVEGSQQDPVQESNQALSSQRRTGFLSHEGGAEMLASGDTISSPRIVQQSCPSGVPGSPLVQAMQVRSEGTDESARIQHAGEADK